MIKTDKVQGKDEGKQRKKAKEKEKKKFNQHTQSLCFFLRLVFEWRRDALPPIDSGRDTGREATAEWFVNAVLSYNPGEGHLKRGISKQHR